MSLAGAKARIRVHAGFDVDDVRPGIIARLRPYKGVRSADVADLVEALTQIHAEVVGSPVIERELCAALWELCWRARILVIDPRSGLRRNGIEGEAELGRLQRWIESIESFAVRMLGGFDMSHCASDVIELIADSDPADVRDYFGFLLPLLRTMVTDEDEDVAAAATRAIARLS